MKEIQNSNSQFKSFYFLLAILSFAFCLLPSTASAQTMENTMYKIQMGNLNSISGESTGSNYNLSITSGETANGVYTGNNYTVKAGFQYVPRSTPFSFSVSSTTIDFGTLTPTNPISRASIS